MRKLVVTCQCGQRMQVPRSAIGKTGMCPTCGQTVLITAENTRPITPPQRGRLFGLKNTSWWRGATEPPEDAKRRFGQAVDLYCSQRYAEAMAIFNSLAKQFPGNPDIENGRAQCIAALKRPPALALEDKSPGHVDPTLDEATVKDVVLEKLIHGSSETIQLQAAELACRMLGLFQKNGHVSAPQSQDATVDNHNGHISAPMDSDTESPEVPQDDTADPETDAADTQAESWN